MTKARRRDFAPQLSELWADEISIHRFWNQICPAVRTFFELCSTYPEADAVVLRKFRVRHYKMLCMTNVIQKLGHHASNLCFAGENDLSAQLLFHWIGFENLSRCCFLKSLQNLFPSFGSFSGGGHSTSTKGCACVSPQNAAWQKSSRNLDITHRICDRNSKHGFFWTMVKLDYWTKSRNPRENESLQNPCPILESFLHNKHSAFAASSPASLWSGLSSSGGVQVQLHQGFVVIKEFENPTHISECEPFAAKGNSLGTPVLPATAAFLQWYAGATSSRFCWKEFENRAHQRMRTLRNQRRQPWQEQSPRHCRFPPVVRGNLKTAHISERKPVAMKGNSLGRSSLPTTAAFLQWYAGATSSRVLLQRIWKLRTSANANPSQPTETASTGAVAPAPPLSSSGTRVQLLLKRIWKLHTSANANPSQPKETASAGAVFSPPPLSSSGTRVQLLLKGIWKSPTSANTNPSQQKETASARAVFPAPPLSSSGAQVRLHQGFVGNNQATPMWTLNSLVAMRLIILCRGKKMTEGEI